MLVTFRGLGLSGAASWLRRRRASLDKQLEAARRWVGRRQLLSAPATGSEPPRLYVRHKATGVAWLSLAWGTALLQGETAGRDGLRLRRRRRRRRLADRQ